MLRFEPSDKVWILEVAGDGGRAGKISHRFVHPLLSREAGRGVMQWGIGVTMKSGGRAANLLPQALSGWHKGGRRWRWKTEGGWKERKSFPGSHSFWREEYWNHEFHFNAIAHPKPKTSQELRNCPMGKEMLYWKGFIEKRLHWNKMLCWKKGHIERRASLKERFCWKKGFIERKALLKTSKGFLESQPLYCQSVIVQDVGIVCMVCILIIVSNVSNVCILFIVCIFCIV